MEERIAREADIDTDKKSVSWRKRSQIVRVIEPYHQHHKGSDERKCDVKPMAKQ